VSAGNSIFRPHAVALPHRPSGSGREEGDVDAAPFPPFAAALFVMSQP